MIRDGLVPVSRFATVLIAVALTAFVAPVMGEESAAEELASERVKPGGPEATSG